MLRWHISGGRAHQAADPDHDQHPTRIDGHVIDEPFVIAMYPHERGPTIRAGRRASRGPRTDPDPLTLVGYLVHHQR